MKIKSNPFLALILLVILGITLAGCGAAKPKEAAKPAPSGSSAAAPSENQKPKDEKEEIKALANKGKATKEMSYTLVMTGAGLSSESKVWLKDNKLKTDSTINGQRTITLFDLTSGETISYLPDDKIATKLKIEEYQGQDNITPIDYVRELDSSNFTLAGTETVNGMECKVIAINTGEASYKEWLSTEYGMVVKVEEEFNGQKVTVQFRNIKLGSGTVPDNTFNLPQGIEVIDMNAMMQKLPSAGKP